MNFSSESLLSGGAAAVDKPLLARLFGRHAATYEEMTPVQGCMAEMLLDGVCGCLAGHPVGRVLELGCGTGRLTRRLAERFPGARIVAVDLSPEMVERARAAVPGAEIVSADAESFASRLTPGVDLIVSNAAVQWFENPLETLAQYRSLLGAGGCLGLTTFGQHTFRELRQALGAAFGDRTSAPEAAMIMPLPPADFWRQAFGSAAVEERLLTRRYPDVRTFLRSLQQAGVGHSGRRRRALSAAVMRRVMALYPGCGAAEGINVTYHIVSLFLVKG